MDSINDLLFHSLYSIQIVVENVTVLNEGLYRISVVNTLDEDSRNVTVKVKGNYCTACQSIFSFLYFADLYNCICCCSCWY